MTKHDDEIKLGRVGHYCTTMLGLTAAVCWTAAVCKVHDDGLVNLAGASDMGNWFSRSFILVGRPEDADQTFHLNRDCPWSR